MDTLYQLFASTFDADPNKRKAAELEIRKLETQDGMLTAAFQIVNSNEADFAVRQAAAIYVKNRVRRGWDLTRGTRSTSAQAISDNDRNALKSGLLPALASVPERLRVHLQSTLLTAIATDFPDKWPELMPAIGTYLSSNEPQSVNAGVRALLQVLSAFRWRDENGIIDNVVSSSFPHILQIARSLLDSPSSSSPEAGTIMHTILKTYARSISMKLTEHQQAHDSIVPWGMLMLNVVSKEIDPSQLPEDKAEKQNAPWWKAKKWAYHCMNRLFSRYGNPTQLPSTMQSYQAFAEGFVAQFAPEILKAYLRQVELYTQQGHFLSDKAISFIFTYFTDCVKPKSTWQLLKPHVDSIVQNFAYPIFCFSEEDAETFEDDPIEFIRSQLDILEEANMLAGRAAIFVESLVTKRKTTFMPQLEFVQSIFQAAIAGTRSPQEKEGAMHLADAMVQMMVNDAKVSPQLDQFFATFIIPELKSQHNFLRFRACELIKTFDKQGMQWSSHQTLEAAFRGVMDCLMDEALPVRVQAAVALGELIGHEEVHQVMAPNAGRLMQELLKLSDETDLDVLMTTQEKVVENFSDELLPFAVELTTQLRDSYVRMLQELADATAQAEETLELDIASTTQEDKMFAAMANLATMYQIVSAAESKPEILAQIEVVILPAIIQTMEKQMSELLDDIFDLVDMLTFYQKSISPGMWNVFEMMHAAFTQWAPDYLTEMTSTFDNLISYGTETFRNNPKYRAMLLEIFANATQNPNMSPADHIAAFKLADVMLLTLKGYYDQELSGILDTVLPSATGSVKPAPDAKVRKWAEVVVLDAFIYNPQLTLQILESKAATGAFLDGIAARVEAYARVHECRACICALINLLSIPPASMPESVQQRAPKILGTLIVHLANMPEIVRKRKELVDILEDIDSDDGEFGVEVDGEGVDQDFGDGDVHDKENEYMEMLAAQATKLKTSFAAKPEGADEEEEEESIDEDDEDDDAVSDSPLDKERIYDSFRKVMQDLQTNHPDAFAQLTSALPTEEQQALHTVSQMKDEDLAALDAGSDDEDQ